MTNAKYVIIKKEGFETAIVFSHLVQHSTFLHFHPVSAGFVQIFARSTCQPGDHSELVISAYGRSETLDLKSRPEDSAIIRKSIEQQSY